MNSTQIREFRRHIREIEREVEHMLKSQSVCCGVTMAQCHVIVELDDMGTSSIVDLARRLMLDTSTLSRTVDGLVREAYVERSIKESNRRFVEVSLTPKGAEKANEINEACDRFYEELFLGAEEEAAVVDAIGRLSDVLSRRRACVCCLKEERGES